MIQAFDWFARNRAKIGGIVSTIFAGIVSIDPALVAAYPRSFAYAALLFGLLFGSGQFKSDSYHREQQRKYPYDLGE